MPLTDVKIRNAKPSDKRSTPLGCGGLYLEVSPAGGKLWRFKYRFQGKEKLLALGKWDTVTLREARELRDEWKKILGEGQRPEAPSASAPSRRQRTGRSIASRPSRASGTGSRPRSGCRVMRPTSFAGCKPTCFPIWAIVQLLRSRLQNYSPPCARSSSGARTTWRTASYKSPRRSSATEWRPVAASVIPLPICAGRSRRIGAKNQAAVRPDDVPALLRAIDGYDQIGDRQTALALRLLARTFVRTGELIGAEWSEFNLDGDSGVDCSGGAHEDADASMSCHCRGRR